ncbi:DUF202 domain-containing protein [Hymenobacter humi]|uniref:DUF202 domain-containing protein n=1 Tax=Hymenobacter humi TaxID=1411620 RepID=A0ABW2U3A3_9BACT
MVAPPAKRHHSLSDQLALERTRMANERTMLAYLRTGLAMIIAGFSLIQFFRANVYVWAGVLAIPLGLGTILLGWIRFRAKARRISQSLLNPGPNA